MKPSNSISPQGYQLINIFVGILLIIFSLSIDVVRPELIPEFRNTKIILILIGAFVTLISIVPRRLLLSTRVIYINISKLLLSKTNHLMVIFYQYYMIEIMCALLIGGLFLRNSLVFDYPIGYAGMYSLATQLLVNNNLIIPSSIPFYGPGGIPFAYPPVGFYIAALTIKYLHLPIFAYLRFGPPFWTFLAIVAMYFLSKKITGSRAISLLASFFFGSAFETYYYHVTAAGMVRGPALFFTIVALIGAYKIFKAGKSTWLDYLITGLFTALTCLTHLSYFLFLVISIGMFAIFVSRNNYFYTLKKLLILAILVALLSAPWLFHVVSVNGFEILSGAASTHGTFYNLWRFFSSESGIAISSIFSNWGSIPLIGFVLLGILHLIGTKRFFLPLWFFVTFLVIGESDRFMLLIGSLMAAIMIIDLMAPSVHSEQILFAESIPRQVVLGIFLIGFIWANSYVTIASMRPSVDGALEDVSDWLNSNTDEQVSYLFFSSDHNRAEWLPFLAQRNPVFGHWGSEWLGAGKYEYFEWNHISSCIDSISIECVRAALSQKDRNYEYIVLPAPQNSGYNPFEDDSNYVLRYSNGKYFVYKVKHAQ